MCVEGGSVQDLSDEGRRIVEALVKAPLAWQSPSELARAIGRDLEETTDLIAVLDADGWLSAWERQGDVVVTLSVAGASVLELRLVESGRDETPRWAQKGDPEPPALRASRVFRDDRAAALERVVDHSTTAEEAVEITEAIVRRHPIPANPQTKPAIENLPGPTLLVGLGLTPWPGPDVARKASCPCCGSKRLAPSMYCLYCDRWGLDHLLLDETRAKPRAPIEPKDESRRRELERQTRQARRKSRRLAQAEAERAGKRKRRQA
jgi:hypothetical protein